VSSWLVLLKLVLLKLVPSSRFFHSHLLSLCLGSSLPCSLFLSLGSLAVSPLSISFTGMFNVFFQKKLDDDPEGEWESCLKPSFGKNTDIGMAGGVAVSYKRGDVRAIHLKHGPGLMVYRNGDVYDGQWDNDRMHGRGKMKFADRAVSSLCRSLQCSQLLTLVCASSFVFIRSQVYDGGWNDNVMHGKGEYIDADGNVFEGTWIEDKKNGLGVMRMADGSQYTGHWKDDMRQDGSGVHASGSGY
jgi:hypothetical protein